MSIRSHNSSIAKLEFEKNISSHCRAQNSIKLTFEKFDNIYYYTSYSSKVQKKLRLFLRDNSHEKQLKRGSAMYVWTAQGQFYSSLFNRERKQ